jgi:hypothetical protein
MDCRDQRVPALSETSQLLDRRLEFVLLNSPQINAFRRTRRHYQSMAACFVCAQTEAEIRLKHGPRTGEFIAIATSLGAWKLSNACRSAMAGLLAGIIAAAAELATWVSLQSLDPGCRHAGATTLPTDRGGSRPDRFGQSEKG